MDLNLEEQLLVANFRKLSAEGRKRVLDLAAALVNSTGGETGEKGAGPDDRCALPRKEARPETATEPIFTE